MSNLMCDESRTDICKRHLNLCKYFLLHSGLVDLKLANPNPFETEVVTAVRFGLDYHALTAYPCHGYLYNAVIARNVTAITSGRW
jgi:hypothetical protein